MAMPNPVKMNERTNSGNGGAAAWMQYVTTWRRAPAQRSGVRDIRENLPENFLVFFREISYRLQNFGIFNNFAYISATFT
jgi:hypothetical protein